MEWRDVVGWEGLYKVSDQGDIWSVRNEMVLKPMHRKEQYFRVCLSRMGWRVTIPVHEIVAKAFIGPKPKGLEICHNNGNGFDNAKTNIRYDTHVNNCMDAVSYGTHSHGERHGRSKLTKAQVLEIRASTKSGKDLAIQYDVSRSLVSLIRNQKLWRV